MASRRGGNPAYKARFVGKCTLAAIDRREEGGHLVIVLLSPFFIRMMVATSALQALPHEKLGDVFGPRFGIVDLSEPNHCWVAFGISRGSQQLPNHDANRLVFKKTLPQPIMERISSVPRFFVASIISQDRRPLRCKIRCVIGRIKQPIGDIGSSLLHGFGCITSSDRQGSKRLNLFNRWQSSSDVQSDPPEESRVVAES